MVQAGSDQRRESTHFSEPATYTRITQQTSRNMPGFEERL